MTFRFDGGDQSRAAADHRPAAGAAEALLGEARVRPDRRSSRRSAAGLTGSSASSPGAIDHLRARARTTGAGICRSTSAATISTRIRYDYYRDTNVALEAFKAGALRLRVENTAKCWATAYTGPPFEQGLDRQGGDPHERGTGMQGFVFNTRRPTLPGSEGARGARLRLRLRVDQQEALLRPVRPDQELLLRQFASSPRAGCRARPSSSCSSRCAASCRRGGVHRDLRAADDRRQPAGLRAEPAHRARAARGKPAG